ncbi:hypothetical protein ACT4S2_09225 [Kocuria turfanensis]|uniref:hypothetical protein n=1 Tax=Kocuria turfanensis TaxID=388357 RepID=UPI004036E7EC
MYSATDCYFDLGHHLVPVDGGYLLHLLSDSQWVRHWLLFVGEGAASAVVTTSYPAGFALDVEESAYWKTEPWEYVVCAPSFAEFAWRWWMDNEIFHAVRVVHEKLTPEQEEYLRGYDHPAEGGWT